MRRLDLLLPLRRDAEELAASLPALMLKARHTAASVLHGTHAKRKAGTGEKFWQYRPLYHRRPPPRH